MNPMGGLAGQEGTSGRVMFRINQQLYSFDYLVSRAIVSLSSHHAMYCVSVFSDSIIIIFMMNEASCVL